LNHHYVASSNKYVSELRNAIAVADLFGVRENHVHVLIYELARTNDLGSVVESNDDPLPFQRIAVHDRTGRTELMELEKDLGLSSAELVHN